MSGRAKALLGLLIARPLIAVVIAAVVVAGALLLGTHRQKTPVTHRTERVRLTDQQQMQLGSQQYAKTLQQYRAQIVSSGHEYSEVQRVAKRIEAVAGRYKPAFAWRVTLLRKNEATPTACRGARSSCTPASCR
jgi:hypothetical protein